MRATTARFLSISTGCVPLRGNGRMLHHRGGESSNGTRGNWHQNRPIWSREAADRMYTADWKKMIADRSGTAPQSTYFETPVIVDNSEPAAADRAA